jgi:ubiquinone/menaquinone biosynthesis C-methylase UbiE
VSHEERADERRLLADLYRNRFSERDLALKSALWAVLCDRFFQRYVSTTDTVLDLGAGSCEFTNAIRAGNKIVVDLNPDTARYARDARFVQASGTDMSLVSSSSVDLIFCSNFLEHLPDKDAVLQTLSECRRVLRPGGKLLVLQPNIRYLPGRFWDYLDHHTPLTHLSMVEALSLAGFVPREVVPRFLPYTVKGTRLPRSTMLLKAYLRLRIIWPIFGRQMLIVAEANREAQ